MWSKKKFIARWTLWSLLFTHYNVQAVDVERPPNNIEHGHLKRKNYGQNDQNSKHIKIYNEKNVMNQDLSLINELNEKINKYKIPMPQNEQTEESFLKSEQGIKKIIKFLQEEEGSKGGEKEEEIYDKLSYDRNLVERISKSSEKTQDMAAYIRTIMYFLSGKNDQDDHFGNFLPETLNYNNLTFKKEVLKEGLIKSFKSGKDWYSKIYSKEVVLRDGSDSK